MRRCGLTPALTVFVAHPPTSSYEEEVEAFYMKFKKAITNWYLFATLAGFWEDFALDNIDDWLVEHLHDCTKKAESFKTTKRRQSPETLELIHQRGAARAAGNQELTSELARFCRETIKEDLKERRAEVLVKSAEAKKSNRYARRQSQDMDDCSPKNEENNHSI
ncbi:hypothetical protein RB195_024819 [Necator americanus]|uniref:Uncharacterized protein n=1 Tax=Necator americanus TaxID=51031 RepID=A0ABR1EQB7_NECAM